MDHHGQDHGLLGAFLAGDLDPAQARRWDEHLLECEQCWRVVREDQPFAAAWPDRLNHIVHAHVSG